MASTLSRIASQSVHITTYPSPRSLSDSKLVLAALQKFGEVVTFRNLKYDTTNKSTAPDRATIAVFESPDSATRAIEASPLTIPLESSKSITEITSSWPSTDSASTASTAPTTSKDQPNANSKYLTCNIQPSHHNHESALRRNPYHTTFYVETDSYHYKDLTGATGIPLKELADGLMGRKEHMPFRIKKKVKMENERLGATSLMGLYREGIAKSEYEVSGKDAQGVDGR